MKIPRRDWLTASEVAARFQVTPATVRFWIHTRQLQAELAMKGVWLIHELAVEEFKKARGGCPSKPGIELHKKYRIKSTGEVITGAELLRRRGNGNKKGVQ